MPIERMRRGFAQGVLYHEQLRQELLLTECQEAAARDMDVSERETLSTVRDELVSGIGEAATALSLVPRAAARFTVASCHRAGLRLTTGASKSEMPRQIAELTTTSTPHKNK